MGFIATGLEGKEVVGLKVDGIAMLTNNIIMQTGHGGNSYACTITCFGPLLFYYF